MASAMETARAILAGTLIIVLGIGAVYIGQTIQDLWIMTPIGIVVMIGGGIIIALTIKDA
ncbi:MAG: hypothetical protein IIA81_03030 [Thaumarchaeota archaeon]|nr:hypothetical protein [Nitrososphaerota archaeon]